MQTTTLMSCILLFLSTACKKEVQDPCRDIKLPVFGTCVAVAPHGKLTLNPTTGTYTYNTKGGGMIILNHSTIQIRHNDYPNFNYELWGGYDLTESTKLSYFHENLNGKHIKDKIGSNRTFIFPDGAKITLAAQNDTLEVLTISIYEGTDSYRINAVCNKTLEHSLSDKCITQILDNEEADGEASSFEISSTGLIFFNLYQEDSPGKKVQNRYNLGELILDNPNNVRDYYDDPRLPHT